ncbi:MAG: hypothetical protein JWO20_3229 [Candidatus Angelobacter sp.]|nr:hypothetical protein [Candidatus Angelobacter sp.]
MLALCLDISHERCRVRDADAERAEAFLPLKSLDVIGVQPSRGIGFYLLNYHRNICVFWLKDQAKMRMVVKASDGENADVEAFRDSVHVCPEARLQVDRNDWDAFFRCENDVNVDA